MPIQTACPHCGNIVSVREAVVGREVRCAKCNLSYTIEPLQEQKPPETVQSLSKPSSAPFFGENKTSKIPDKRPQPGTVNKVDTTVKRPSVPSKPVAHGPNPVQSAQTSSPPPMPKPAPAPVQKTPTAPPPSKPKPQPAPISAAPIAPVAPAGISSSNAPGDFWGELSQIHKQEIAAEKEPTLSEAERSRLLKELLTPLDRDDFEAEDVSAKYRSGIAFTIMVSILMLLLYFGMILGIGYGVYYCFAGLGGVFCVLGVILAILVVFMIRPIFYLFTGSSEFDPDLELKRENEPLLYEFVDKLANYVGADPPEKVYASSEINAAAYMQGGIFSALFGTGRFNMIIGLPLVSGMNMRELAGVMAHELGHMTQQKTIRMLSFSSRLTHWFLFVAIGRTHFDYYLARISYFSKFTYYMFMPLQLCIWVTRWILLGMFYLILAVSRVVYREMEFDADQFAVRVVGHETFVKIMRKTIALGLAEEKSDEEFMRMLREARLLDDLPNLIGASAEVLGDSTSGKVDKFLKKHGSTTKWHDVHPCMVDRFKNAEEINHQGVFHHEGKPRLLFQNFDSVSRNATIRFYESKLGKDFPRSLLKPTKPAIEKMKRQMIEEESMATFFQKCINPLRAFYFPAEKLVPPINPQDSLEKIRQAREFMVVQNENHRKTLKNHLKLDAEYIDTKMQSELRRVRAPFDYSLFKYHTSTYQKSLEASAVAFAQRQSCDRFLRHWEVAAGDRLYLVLSLLYVEPIAKKIEDAESKRRRMEMLFPLMLKLSQLHSKIFEVRDTGAVFSVLHLSYAKTMDANGEPSMELYDVLIFHAKEFERKLLELGYELHQYKYPFISQNASTMAEYLLPGLHPGMNSSELYELEDELLSRYFDVYYLLVGEMARVAESVEKALGMTPLPAPDDDDEDEDEKD